MFPPPLKLATFLSLGMLFEISMLRPLGRRRSFSLCKLEDELVEKFPSKCPTN